MGYARPSREEDADDLAPRMREVDAKECRVLGGVEPIEALRKGMETGVCRTIIADDGQTPIGMFGAAPTVLPGVGTAWLLATDDLIQNRSHAQQFLAECHGWVFWMHTHHPVLFNLILEENRIAIRWLKWMGFNFEPSAYPGVLMFSRSV